MQPSSMGPENHARGDRLLQCKRIANHPLIAMLIAILLFGIAVAASMLLGKLVPSMDKTIAAAIRALTTIGLLLAVYKLVVIRLGEPRRDDLVRARSGRDLGGGLLMGFGLFCGVVGIAAIAGVYTVVGEGSTERLLRYAIAAIGAAFAEELLFRGILFRWIEQFGGSWAALMMTSALFGIAHIINPNATWFSSFAIAMEAGILLGGAYMLTRSLWMPIGIHAAWNFTQGFIFDVPVSGADSHGLVEAKLSGPELLSGGPFGLEASLISVIVATAAGIWLVVLAIRRGQLVRPSWATQHD